MKFTVFTPAYNRAYTLQKLYNSILNQNYQNFEWLVVDDGSTDNTQELVQRFISEGKIKIRYYKQENQGKHIAINTALELAEGDYFLTIDSDDYLTDDCLQVCSTIAKKINNKKEFAGFTFIHFAESIQFDKAQYGKKEWTEDSYQWEHKGEMNFVFKTKIARQNPFPVFKGEKFCKESLFFAPIKKKYKILYTDNVLARGEYLEDGLTKSMYQNMLKSPTYALLHIKMRFSEADNDTKKWELTKIYWDIAMKTGGGFFKNIWNLPIYWTIKFFLSKIKNRKNK